MERYCVWTFLFLLLSSFPGELKSAKILFYFGVSTYSHRIIAWPLVETLAARGHEVSFLSPFPIKKPHPNVTDLVPEVLHDLFISHFGQDSDLIRDRFTGNRQAVWNFIPFLGLQSCQVLLESSKWQKWISENSFDLVVIDAMYGECGLGLAYKFKARVIYFKTNTLYPWEFDMLGLPLETSWIPDVQYDYKQNMDFWTRVKNTIHPIYNHWYHIWVYHPPLEKVMREGLKLPEMPSIQELQGRISVVLMNAHYSTDYARSIPPMIVPIAGMTTEPSQTDLTKEMTQFIQSSGQDGFIYVSFGSAVQVSKLDIGFQEIFFHAFGNSSIKFIWKYEGEVPDSMPSNVFTGRWMPQKAILSSFHCKGFITHGGLGSIHEAMFYGIPLIVMPIFADQNYNAERIERLGHGMSLELTTLTQEELQNGIKKLMKDSSYQTRMREISVSFKDRQNTPLETAIWWTEKVLRSTDFDLSLLRPLGIYQRWYVRRLLDVRLFLLVLTFGPLGVLSFVVFKLVSSILVKGRLKSSEPISEKKGKKGKKVKST